jgi:cytochrome c-type biogenesis protein CcmH
MTVFWSLAAVMVMVALLFVLPPLLRKRELTAVSRDDLNTEVIKAQLAELDADLAAGKLDQAQYAAARSDLERELLYDLTTTGPAQHEPRSGRWATLLIIPALPLCAVLLYQQLGSEELIDRLQQVQSFQSQTVKQQSASIEDMITKLSARLQQQPDDLEGWTMLARTYNILERYSKAEAAYENVLRLGGENAGLLTDYADAMVMANGGMFTDKAGALLTRALELDPNNVKALWLAGHWKNQSGMYAEAIGYWQKAALLLPDDGQDKPVITRQIQQAQQQLGIAVDSEQQAAASPADVTPDNSASGVTLQVQVSLDPALATKTSPGDTVFIFARAAQGPRMPLAIVRKQVKDLPVSVVLDDTMAMAPGMMLSGFEEVLVGARISKSGNAMAQSGDLQGSKSPVRTADSASLDIVIDNVVQ